jgi:hypothetical protein
VCLLLCRRIKHVTAGDLERVGVPLQDSRKLLHAASLSPAARARMRVGRIRALRRAFDTADVDSNDRLEREELEVRVIY